MEKYTFFDGTTPTDEQCAVIDFAKNQFGSCCVNALAGSGKTKTIVKILDCIPKGQRVLFLAHNKSIQQVLEKKVNAIIGDKQERIKKGIFIRIYTYHALALRIYIEYMDSVLYSKTSYSPVHRWPKEVCSEFYNYMNHNGKYSGDDAFAIFSDFIFDDDKYKRYINSHLDEISEGTYKSMDNNDKLRYRRNLIKMIDYGRHNRCQCEKEFKKISRKYGVSVIANECSACVKILEWGKTNLRHVDYQDLLWLPYELKYGTIKYQADFILIDEAQDSSPLQQELLRKCLSRKGRFCAVGDKNQAINSFCGSDAESFESIKNIQYDVKEFNMTKCFRCDKNILKHANEEVYKIEEVYGIKTDMHSITPLDSAGDGEVKYNVSLNDVNNGSLIICRNTSPLTELYRKYISMGRNVHMVGESVTTGFVELLKEIHGEDMEEVYENLDRLLISTWIRHAEIMHEELIDSAYSEEVNTLYDQILSIKNISQGFKTKSEVLEFIKGVFINEIQAEEELGCALSRDEKQQFGILLSTIHKAKGLEADEVYMLAPSLVPSKLVREDQEWEKVAETNLLYVAITRAKHVYGYIDEHELHANNSFFGKDKRYKEFCELREKLGL